MATLYFGGYKFPFMDSLGLSDNVITLLGVAFLFIKILLFIFFFIWVRWTIPRFRYDQLMNLGWKMLIPLAIVNVLLTGAVMLAKQNL
jgi:NADH-quinone oxidoreductase subunit H